jgi:hypothetical protein
MSTFSYNLCNSFNILLKLILNLNIIPTFKNLPFKSKQKKGGPKFTMWNTNKEGGWDNYKRITEENTKLDEVANDTSDDPDMMLKKINKELNKI